MKVYKGHSIGDNKNNDSNINSDSQIDSNRRRALEIIEKDIDRDRITVIGPVEEIANSDSNFSDEDEQTHRWQHDNRKHKTGTRLL